MCSGLSIWRSFVKPMNLCRADAAKRRGPILLRRSMVPLLCRLFHDWFYIDGNRRRTCLRCHRYERLSTWESARRHGAQHEAAWAEDR